MKIQRRACLPLLLAVALGACDGEEVDDALACIPPDDPRASDPALRGQLEICSAVPGGIAAAASSGPVTNACAALEVGAWRVSIRYSGELGARAPDGRRVIEHQVTAELGADLQMQRRANASGEDWSPSGRVTQQLREYADGELILQASGEGAPVPGNSSTITDSRILLSIDASNCSYNLYSTGTVLSQATRRGETSTGPAGYGTVIIRNQPATLAISESRRLPVLEASDDPRVEMPELYIPGIGTQEGEGVLVSWEIEPLEN